MIVFDRLGNGAFDLAANCNCKGETLRGKSSRRPGDIDQTQKFAVVRMPYWGSRTRPELNFPAEMLPSVDLHRFQRRQGGSDGVSPNIRLTPASTLFEVEVPAKIDGARISLRLQDKSRGVRQHQHRVRFGEEEAGLLERTLSRFDKSGTR